MPSPDPHSRGRRVLMTVAVSAVSLMLVQCDPGEADPPAPLQTETPDPTPAPQPRLSPAPATALGRGDLIRAAGQAASAYAQGQVPTNGDSLIGRRFAVRMPFGCSGPSTSAEGAAADGIARWTWAPDRTSIQITLTPGDWAQSALMAQPNPSVAAPVWEAVEGFWIPRPWLAAETCPAIPRDPLQPDSAGAAPQTVGLAAVFETGGSRVGRRNGKAYAFTVRPQGDQTLVAPAGGYRLLLEGRIVGFPNGRAMRCRAPGPDQRPVCVAAVKLDTVAFEDAKGTTLSAWRDG